MTAVPVASAYGIPAAVGTTTQLPGTVMAPPGGMEFQGRGRCKANNDTCEGFPAKGTEFCIGHLRQLEKFQAEKAAEAAAEES